MLVTIISDGSFCPFTNSGGYGFWIASKRGKLQGSGAFKEQSSSSLVVEMRAIMNGLHRALKDGLVLKGDKVLLQTDCTAAIDTFLGKRKYPHAQEQQAVEYFHMMVNRFKLTYEFRHVKGHTTPTDPRFSANRLCDKLAKKAMRKARSKVNEFRIKT